MSGLFEAISSQLGFGDEEDESRGSFFGDTPTKVKKSRRSSGSGEGKARRLSSGSPDEGKARRSSGSGEAHVDGRAEGLLAAGKISQL